MSKFHAYPKRHAATTRDHGAIAWVLALVAGAIAFYPTFLYFNVTGVLGEMTAEDVTLLSHRILGLHLPPSTTR